MKSTRLVSQIVGLSLLVVVYLTACGTTSQATSTPVPPTLPPAPTSTPVPPTLPPAPTSTPVPPTLPPAPTSTPVPPAPSASPTESRNPAPRAYTSIAYDSKSQRVILFGGQTGSYLVESGFNGETWAYDSAANKWTQMKPPSGPTNRSAHELVYDSESDRVILFGGCYIVLTDLVDTWAYDYNTNTWKEMTKGPSYVLGFRLAYDIQSDKVILFGGYNVAGNFYYNNTWAFDFNTNTWTNMKPVISPPGRNYQAMTYDSKADRVLVWGGKDLDGIKPVDESIWSYDFDTNTWLEMMPGEGAHPAGRDYPAMVYNAKVDRTILYGGDPGGDETWAFDYKTNTWTKLTPSTSPGPLSKHSMVYNSATDRVNVFGGEKDTTQYKYSDELWAYDFTANTWTNVTQK